VQCVSAGDATVVITVTPPGGAPVERELHTQLGAVDAVVNDYVIRLTGLAPSPLSNRPIPAADYVATFTVNRR
jgi:hypothetical protein